MRLVTFSPPAAPPRLGALAGGRVVDLAAALPACPTTMMALLDGGTAGLDAARRALAAGLAAAAPGTRYDLAVVTLLAPLPRPGKIIGIGRNYGAHAAEDGQAAHLPQGSGRGHRP